jgi:hypothetical protein
MVFTTTDPPRLWGFSGPCGRDTQFDLRVTGRPDVKALQYIVRHLELTIEFFSGDEAEQIQNAPTPPMASGEADAKTGAERSDVLRDGPQ